MKNIHAKALLIFGAFLLAVCLKAQDNEDLLSILKKETEAFTRADFEEWKSYWHQTENAYFSYAEQNSVFSVKGWAAIEEAFKGAMEGLEKYDANFRRENVKVERQGKLAFITFDQYDKLGYDAEVHKKESRVMKETDGIWKILSTEVVNMSSFDRTGKELHHILMASFKPDAKEADIRYIFDQFNSIVNEVEGMNSCTMLENEDSSGPFQYIFIMTFASEEALAKYEAHASHQAAVERWIQVGDKLTVVDSWK